MELNPCELDSFSGALADGVILDVTELAESIGFHANVFISVGYWSTPPISRTEGGLIAAMEIIAAIFEQGSSTKAEQFDGETVWTFPFGSKEGNELANVFRVWRDERRRLNVIVIARGESLDFRVKRSANGGSLYTQ